MGLLDDAIREHLELKRLRGADPSDVARAEQDALGPVHREQGSEPDKPPSGQTGDSSTGDGLSSSEPEPVSEPDASVSTSAHGSQETVEINMEAELASEGDLDPSPTAQRDAHARPVAHPASARAISDESLEWEVPADEFEESSGRAELDDALGPNIGEASDRAEPVEDVLEETPDFLRDTPEQERLWFEQRPPRDFDFNE